MRTFCFAEHFPKENVQQNKMLQMHFGTKEHFPLENVQLQTFNDFTLHFTCKMSAYIFQRKCRE